MVGRKGSPREPRARCDWCIRYGDARVGGGGAYTLLEGLPAGRHSSGVN